MNYETNSIFENSHDIKGSGEWETFREVAHDRVSAFQPVSPRSSYEPRYTNIVHINRYRTA